MRTARLFRSFLLSGALAFTCAASLHAQYELKGGVSNYLSYRPGSIPIGPTGTPTGEPTITPQFANVVETSGAAGPISASPTLSARFPSSTVAVLQRASIGSSFVSGVPRYFLGDRITPPTSYISSTGAQITVASDFWRAEPLRAAEIVVNPSGQPLKDSTGVAVVNSGGVVIPAPAPGAYEHFYYSKHAKRVFASESGQVEIWWRSRVPDASNNYVLTRETFTVSSATSSPVRTLYWTEKTFNGPRVAIPSGRIVTVNAVFSNTFPATVATEFVPVGSSPPSDPNAQAASELRTFWFETSNGNGELHAYNISGRLMIEYLGAQQPDGSHEFLGADIVAVAQSAPASTQTVFLGDEIRPNPEDFLLLAQPVSSSSSSSVSYFGSFARPDGTLAYYAERENNIEDRVIFYWMERLDAAVLPNSGLAPGLQLDWPKYLHKYLQVWPTDVKAFSHYTIALNGSSATTGTGLKFEGGRIPTVIFQDDLEQDEVVLDPSTQRLLVGLSGDQLSRALLKFTGDNGGIWYVRLMTQADGRPGFLEGDGGVALTGAAFVGDRIAPPSADYSLAGYIAAGTSYSPSAYRDPFAVGITSAETGAIIPVNALPAGASNLTVWWFKKVAAPSSEFGDFYTTAKVGHYTVNYRTDSQKIVLASNAGSGDLSPAQNTGFVYVQNDAQKIGFNPNEEHALMLSGRVYALRDDLNITTGANFTSLPRVLLQFTNSTDGRPAMTVYEVVREDATHHFEYPITAGTIINSPMPLPKLPLPVDAATGLTRNLEVTPNPDLYPPETVASGAPAPYAQFTFKDRKGYDWIYRGPHEDPSLTGLPSAAGPLANTEFNTAGNMGLWTSRTNVANATVANGNYSGQGSGNGDAQIATANLPAFAGFGVTTIHIRIRASANASTQLFWANEDGGFTGARSLTVPYSGAGTWQTLVFNVAQASGWSGKTINALRFDPVESAGVTFDIDWIRSHQASPALGMQWYYTMRSDFFIPGRALTAQPAEGTILPYLRVKNPDGTFVGDPVTATPLTVAYVPVWPDNVATMSVGETLSLPNHGLPAVRGQSSAVVFYQQSIARTGPNTASVTLHDPTRSKSVLLNDARVGLTTLPASIATTSQRGKTYFQLLPPHLQQRVYFDGTLGEKGGIVLIGEFVDEIAGEDYLHLNALSAADIASLEGLVDNSDVDAQKWRNAVSSLATRVETFIENPSKRGTYIADSTRTVTVGKNALAAITDSDTAVDSYALTATGAGAGYATLIFGNGYAFTPKGEPVSVAIVRIVPQLYTGDLKVLSATNPLDEQTTLRHSSDYAARPEDFEFEWRYSQPIDGVVPPIYSYAMEPMLGNAPVNKWQLATNPSTPLPAVSSYPATLFEFPRTFALNNSAYNPTSGLPGTVARSSTPVHFANSVPSQIVFSAELGSFDGFVLYVNRQPALASRLPAGTTVPNNLTQTDPRSGLSSLGLSSQYYIPPAYFTVGDNSIEVAFYSSASANAVSSLNLRIDASVETDRVVALGSPWIKPNGTLSNIVVVGGTADSPLGNPLIVFSDNYFTLRYRAKPGTITIAGDTWSRWMPAKLVESWIKRALDGINPFNQRNNDLFNNPVSTDVSILTQAGKRWEGDVALNLNNINDFGLIEIYETLLNRAKNLSIDAGYDDPGTNDTLLLVAGYLHDLYIVLGNEAADDADNPTIAIDGELTAGEVSTSRFSFEGQLSTLIDEELALLRGRDDFLSPGVTVAPSYNRLYWNYINGIDSGESIYAVNYDIKEKSGSSTANGVLDAADAQHMFPQGHGDAYGHYLTALKGYYKLITSPYFTWTPRTEGVSVLGQTVQVDYQDERKFAAAAAAVARTAARTLHVTARKSYRDDPSVGWAHQRDGKFNTTTNIRRYWGTDEWAARGGQGAYLNWVSANAMLPDVDNNPQHNGIQIIDRTTVPEISEIVSSAIDIQSTLDAQSDHLNPLGLAKGAIAFDISPTELKAGKSHYEQIYARAIQASLNAKAAFDRASSMNRLLRNQNNSLDDYNHAIDKQERAYQYQLLDLFGSPYAGDVGPGKTYEQGYTGPDLYRYYFVDRPSAIIDTATEITVSYRAPLEANPFTAWSLDNVYKNINDPLRYTTRTDKIVPQRIMQFSPTGSGSRLQPGAIQAALLEAYEAEINARESAAALKILLRRFDRDYQLFTEFRTGFAEATATTEEKKSLAGDLLKAAKTMKSRADQLATVAGYVQNLYDGFAAAPPLSVGLSFDATSAARSLFKNSGAIASHTLDLAGQAIDTASSYLEQQANQNVTDGDALLSQYEWNYEDKQHVVEFERLYYEVLRAGYEISRRLGQLQKANEQITRLVAKADQVLSERESFRRRAAAVIQGYRTRDMTYRTFRNEELSQYQALFDLAAQYSYLAVQSYDYETGLLGTPAGRSVIDGIVATRSLGDFDNGIPLATTNTRGDGGIASVLARLQSDWSVVKSRLGINNPDNYGTLFSLRQELFRIRTDASTTEDDKAWRQILEQHIMSNVLNDPDVALYCRNIRKSNGAAVPGIVISFTTTIGHGLNFFGRPLAAGDHSYTASNFATKIYSTGVVLDGYIGMDPYAIGTPNAGKPASSNPNALSATPYVYLIPAGVDSILAPPFGDTGVVRSWSVKDQAIPLPFNLGQTAYSGTQLFTPQGTLNEQLWIARKHQAFRPVSDPAFFYSTMPSEFTNSRLVGRSVWNSQWKLVIPAYTLLNDEQLALDRLVRTITDIRLFLRTYSHSGN